MKTPFKSPPSSDAVHETTRAEVELLVCCARTQLRPEQVDRIHQLLNVELDWQFLVSLAMRHRVLPLLFHHLKQIAPNKIPPPFLADFQDFSSRHMFQNLSRLVEVARLIDLLKQHNIQAIPFKGPTLALNIYGEISLRQFDDLDILVAPCNFLKARQILLEYGGYQPPRASWFFSVEQELANLQSGYECSLVNPTQKTIVDLHKTLTGGTFLAYPFEFHDLWQRLIPVSQAHQLSTFDPEDLLIYLCVHGAKSLWQRLVWICDVAELVKANPTINWDALLQKAQAAKIERMLLLGLRLAQQVLGLTLPTLVEERIDADSETQALANQVHQSILSGESGLTATMDFEKLRFQCRTLSSLKEQVHYLVRCFYRHGLTPIRRLFRPTRNDALFIKLPMPLYFLYYLIRPIRLFSNAIIALWKGFPTQSST